MLLVFQRNEPDPLIWCSARLTTTYRVETQMRRLRHAIILGLLIVRPLLNFVSTTQLLGTLIFVQSGYQNFDLLCHCLPASCRGLHSSTHAHTHARACTRTHRAYIGLHSFTHIHKHVYRSFVHLCGPLFAHDYPDNSINCP